jgi:preprotein translocase subunit SecF
MSASGDRERKLLPDERHLRSGLWAVFMALIGLLVAVVVVAFRWNNESGVAALGAVTSSIAAIVSAYFGIQYSQRAVDAKSPSKKRRPR